MDGGSSCWSDLATSAEGCRGARGLGVGSGVGEADWRLMLGAGGAGASTFRAAVGLAETRLPGAELGGGLFNLGDIGH